MQKLPEEKTIYLAARLDDDNFHASVWVKALPETKYILPANLFKKLVRHPYIINYVYWNNANNYYQIGEQQYSHSVCIFDKEFYTNEEQL